MGRSVVREKTICIASRGDFYQSIAHHHGLGQQPVFSVSRRNLCQSALR